MTLVISPSTSEIPGLHSNLLHCCVVALNTHARLVSPPQQKHKQDGTEQNGKGAHGGYDDLRHHLHVAGQGICEHTVSSR